MEQEKRQRQYRYIRISAIAVCLVIIVGMGIAMPRVMVGIPPIDYANTGMMASIFMREKPLTMY